MARQAFSKAERKAILDRDGHKCVRCGNTTALHLHHIVAVLDGGTNEHDNIMTLCARCHDEWHYIETHYTILFAEWRHMPPYHILYGIIDKLLEFSSTQQVLNFVINWKSWYESKNPEAD